MEIQEMMSKPVVTCRSSDTLNTAARLMWEHDCGAIPIVDHEGSLVGIVTDRDICMAAYTKGTVLEAIGVSEVMSKQIASCQPDDSLEEVERLMSAKQIRRIPVVNRDNRVIGLISMNDIARYAVAAGRKAELGRDVAKTFAAICRPRSPSMDRQTAPS